MPQIYVVSDSKAVLEELTSALEFVTPEVSQYESAASFYVAVRKKAPSLAVVDMQVGNIGGMAICMDLHLEESGGRLGHVPVLMLLDRRADVFLARRSRAEGFLVKPLDSFRIADAAKAILAGNNYEDESYRPLTIEAS